MVLQRVSDQPERPHLTSRSSESDLITTSSRSRTESLLQKVDFNSGIKSLNPYRSFYTSLKFEEGKLRHLDRKLAHEFQVKNLTIEEEDEEGGSSPMTEFSTSPLPSSEDQSAARSFKQPKSSSEKAISSTSTGSPSSSRPSSSNNRPSSSNNSKGKNRQSKFFFDLKSKINSVEERVTRAAVYIHDAIHERPIKTHRSVGLPMQAYTCLHNYWYRFTISSLSFVHLMLAFLEPALNYEDPDKVAFSNSFGKYGNDVVEKVLWIETVIVAVYALDVGMNLYCAGVQDYFGVRKVDRQSIRLKAITDNLPSYQSFKYLHQFKFFALIAFVIDIYFSWGVGLHARRFSRLLRPMYFTVWSPELRRWGMLICRTVPHIWELLVLLVVVLTVFSVAGVMLFGRPEMKSYYTDDLQNFENFPLAFIAMYVLFTTENYPDIMTPSYDSNKMYAIFFCSFLMIVMFFLGNLAIPTLYRAFKLNHHKEALHGRILERTALLAAFQLLDIERKGQIELQVFKRVLAKVRPDMFDPKTGEEKERGIAKTMFFELAQTDPERKIIYPIDFFRCCEVILIDWASVRGVSAEEQSLYDRICGNGDLQHFRQKLQVLLESVVFDKIILSVTSIVTLLLAFFNSGVIPDWFIEAVAEIYIYCCAFEQVLKMYAIGFRTLSKSWATKYDLAVIGWSLFCQVAGLCADSIVSVVGENDATRFLMTYRRSMGSLFIVLRFIRVIFISKRLRKLKVVLTIYPFMANSMALTLLFLYFWALGGMYLFGELDMYSDITTNCQLEYESSLDFSNFAAANMRLFQILTSSNWHLIMYTSMCTMNHRYYAFYFILFHLIAVLILLQIVIAIYVEAFIAFQDKDGEEDKEIYFEDGDDSYEESSESGSRTASMRLNEEEIHAVAEMRRQQFILNCFDKRKQVATQGGHLTENDDGNGSGSFHHGQEFVGVQTPDSRFASYDTKNSKNSTVGSKSSKGSNRRVRVGSMPGFVSPLNVVARMDMPAFVNSEIEVLTSIAPPGLQLREAAEKANEKEQRERLESKHLE
ncbi:hypothetical protein TrST_g13904 [Triparma strigata]|uniref:EF-hand domain-containing protein n=1 Tax=Triparma strigata TaxID=1606541 RepID=A0A9W7BDL1_9STRA|nr:hypothetical protein TrST_g13904 [Triparma strigata]